MRTKHKGLGQNHRSSSWTSFLGDLYRDECPFNNMKSRYHSSYIGQVHWLLEKSFQDALNDFRLHCLKQIHYKQFKKTRKWHVELNILNIIWTLFVFLRRDGACERSRQTPGGDWLGKAGNWAGTQDGGSFRRGKCNA